MRAATGPLPVICHYRSAEEAVLRLADTGWLLCYQPPVQPAFCLWLLVSGCVASAADAADTNRLSTLQRLEPARLAAVQDARQKLAAARRPVPQHGLYDDFRAVLHVHAEDSDHTKGTRAEVLAAAQQTGVRAVFLTDHRGPKVDTWRGLRDGVLFVAGSEDDGGVLRFPEFDPAGQQRPDGALKFLSHLEERYDASPAGFAGLEIVNRHTSAKLDKSLHLYLLANSVSQTSWAQVVELFRKFPDEMFGAADDPRGEIFAKWDADLVKQRLTGIAANDAHQNQVFQGVTFDPYAISFRNLSTHILAPELTEPALREALRAGRAYVAHDWLCDPTGFGFYAVNNLGAFAMGETAPNGLFTGKTRLMAQAPVPARFKLIHRGKVVADKVTSRFEFEPTETGPYRLEAWLEVAGEWRPWIYANPVYVGGNVLAGLRVPPSGTPENVASSRNLTYTPGRPEDATKHMLDVYGPKDAKSAPVFVFLHGGAWRFGDRTLYPPLGNHFAKHGIVTVVPSYRLAPQHPFPAQAEDAAAAVAWAWRNAAKFGGDTNRFFVGGHSAGGHLAALVALDRKLLAAHGVTPEVIKGVLGLSGVYDLREAEGGLSSVFGREPAALRAASPLLHLGTKAPPFLLSYCQWDYYSLPHQARQFHAALKDKGFPVTLEYTPGENHIMEVFAYLDDTQAIARRLLEFLNSPAR